MIRRRVLLALVAAGCGSTQSRMAEPPIEHPLVHGEPLEARTLANVGVVTEADCNRWPFEDTVTVRVTEAQICVAARRHTNTEPGRMTAPEAPLRETFQVVTDVAPAALITVEKMRASNVSTCLHLQFAAPISIWAFDYEGCAPNNGIVTRATSFLRVGNASWTLRRTAPRR